MRASQRLQVSWILPASHPIEALRSGSSLVGEESQRGIAGGGRERRPGGGSNRGFAFQGVIFPIESLNQGAELIGLQERVEKARCGKVFFEQEERVLASG